MLCRIMFVSVLALGMVCGVGCDSGRVRGQGRPLGAAERKATGDQMHLCLPDDVMVVVDEEASPEPPIEAHNWLVYSKKGFGFSLREGQNQGMEYRVIDSTQVDGLKELIRRLAPDLNVGRTREMMGGGWKAGPCTYNASLLKTDTAEYLIVQRFRNVSATSPATNRAVTVR